MPIHDWTRVKAGIFHHFHQRWIGALSDALNAGVLPEDYYALADQGAAGYGPDVLTLQSLEPDGDGVEPSSRNGSTMVQAPPRTRFMAESPQEFCLRKKSTIAVRHVSDDRVIAMVEVISPGNKSGRTAFQSLATKILKLLHHKIHLLLLDLLPPTKRDLHGLHAALWEDIAGASFVPPADKPLTAVAYEAANTVKAYIEPLAVGDVLPDMPLFLEPGAHVLVPLEATYQEAFAQVPLRWRRVLDTPVS